MQRECINYTYKKLIITRSNMYKMAESFKRQHEEKHPELYCDGELPSLNWHLTQMIKSCRYVLSADFLARGYAFERRAAEKMWLLTCCPEEATEEDMMLTVFKNNPEFGIPRESAPEEPGIWRNSFDMHSKVLKLSWPKVLKLQRY